MSLMIQPQHILHLFKIKQFSDNILLHKLLQYKILQQIWSTKIEQKNSQNSDCGLWRTVLYWHLSFNAFELCYKFTEKAVYLNCIFTKKAFTEKAIYPNCF